MRFLVVQGPFPPLVGVVEQPGCRRPSETDLVYLWLDKLVLFVPRNHFHANILHVTVFDHPAEESVDPFLWVVWF